MNRRFYLRETESTGTTYLEGVHAIPPEAIPISEARYLEVIANPAPGKVRSHDADGLPILIDAPVVMPTAEQLCVRIDNAADAARSAVVGDPVRSLEYQKAADEAQAFADAGYPADAVPRTVAAYVTAERTAQQAADSILAEAAAYNEALYFLRETRLQAKERVRKAMDAGDIELAQTITDETAAAIQAAVAGVGNAGA